MKRHSSHFLTLLWVMKVDMIALPSFFAFPSCVTIRWLLLAFPLFAWLSLFTFLFIHPSPSILSLFPSHFLSPFCYPHDRLILPSSELSSAHPKWDLWLSIECTTRTCLQRMIGRSEGEMGDRKGERMKMNGNRWLPSSPPLNFSFSLPMSNCIFAQQIQTISKWRLPIKGQTNPFLPKLSRKILH